MYLLLSKNNNNTLYLETTHSELCWNFPYIHYAFFNVEGQKCGSSRKVANNWRELLHSSKHYIHNYLQDANIFENSAF